ncbi:MAG: hypothetical protein P8099_10890 [Gemmatimonadota bacterium]|jgi:photosystem II stability/assembly factor-like uncharacterized protein
MTENTSRASLVLLLGASAALILTAEPARAQSPDTPTPPTPAAWRFVGPYRAGWATVAAGIPDQPNTYYFGGAGGGVWKTTDAGRTWQGLMQHQTSSAIGALAIAPSNPNVIYVGTGQVAARYDIMAGDGVYRSDDGGQTWKNVGLDATRHVGAILIDPKDPQRVLVAALGHVFGPNPERGVYLTTDGGAHWQHVLALGDTVGAVDLAWDPEHPSVVYAAAWQMHMHPWLDYFQPQAGPGSGVYKSTDEGVHWQRLEGHGFPQGMVGRIGLGVARGSAGRIVYATVAIEGTLSSLTGPAGKTGIYSSHDGGATWTQTNDDAALGSSYFGRVTVAPDDSATIYMTGQSIRVSHDGGHTFTVFKGSPGGDDYHDIWINPKDPTHIIAGADQGAAVTLNGGKAWSSWYNQPTGQLYHLGVDDRFPYHIYSGQQDNGTVELVSRGPYGVIDERDWHPVGGDERDDMLPKPGDPELVFGSGLGGHTSRFQESTRQSAEISPWPVSSYGARPTTVKYRYTWITPLVFSPFPPHALFMGSQVLFKTTDNGDHWQVISPDLSGAKKGAKDCQDPNLEGARDCGFGVIYDIAPSPLSKGLIWVGTDDGLIQVTHDDGGHWTNVTPPDIPTWARINDVEPSPFDSSIAYVAVDLHRLDRFEPMALRTTDGGQTWQRIDYGLPKDQYVSVVRVDPVKPGLLYAGTNRGVYVSLDDGANWQSLSKGFPTTWVRDIRVHGNDLIVATQGRGIWVLDDVSSLRQMSDEITDEDAHLFDPATTIRLRESENKDTPWPPSTPVAQNPPTGAVIDYWLRTDAQGPVTLTIRDAAGTLVRKFSSDEKPEHLPANRYFQKGWLGTPQTLSASAGLHRFVWDLRYPRPKALSYSYSIAAIWQKHTPLEPRGPLVLPGKYTVTLEANGQTKEAALTVKLDPRVDVSDTALQEQLSFTQAVDSTMERAVAAHEMVAQRLKAHTSGRTADRLRALNAGDPGFATIAGTLASLATAAQSADAAPTQGDRDVLAAYQKELEGLLAQLKRLR